MGPGTGTASGAGNAAGGSLFIPAGIVPEAGSTGGAGTGGAGARSSARGMVKAVLSIASSFESGFCGSAVMGWSPAKYQSYHTFSRQSMKAIFITDFWLAGCKVNDAVVMSIEHHLRFWWSTSRVQKAGCQKTEMRPPIDGGRRRRNSEEKDDEPRPTTS
jgi:hypothetical protein